MLIVQMEVFANDFDSLLISLNVKKMYISKINQLIDDDSIISSLANNAKNTFKVFIRYDSQASSDYYNLYDEIINMNERE